MFRDKIVHPVTFRWQIKILHLFLLMISFFSLRQRLRSAKIFKTFCIGSVFALAKSLVRKNRAFDFHQIRLGELIDC